MSIELVMSLGGVHATEVEVARMVRLVPALAAGLLRTCDVVARTSARSLLLRVRLAQGPTTAAAIERLAFWSARAHGMAIAVGEEGEAAATCLAAAAEASDLLERGVSSEALPGALGRAIDVLWPAAPREEAGALPILTITADGWRRDGLRYDARRRVLAMATPLAPPVGDEMVVSMTFAVPRREVRSGARVVGVQRASGPEHRAGGFVTSLAIDAPLCRELARTAARVREPKAHSDFRRARFVHARASRRASEEAASLRGASTEGAVLATRRPAPCGACVLVTVHLPVVGERTMRAVVERATRRGMIVRFAVDASEEAALGAGLAAFALQPRRVLLIDRNRVRREETAQTLRGEGFHVLTARVSPSGTLRRRPGEPFDVVVATCARRDDALPLLGALRGISRDEAAPAVVLRASLASSFDARLLRAEADEVVGLSTSAADLARLTREVLDAAPPLGEPRVPPQACAAVATSVAV